MARFDYRKLSVADRSALMDELIEAMSALKTRDDLQKFLLQLVTPGEAIMLARRWQIAKRLAAGDSYLTIANNLSVGMSTIASVEHWLSDAIGAYEEKLEAEYKTARKRRLQHIGWRLRGPFPETVPFLLLNLLVGGVQKVYWEERLAKKKKK